MDIKTASKISDHKLYCKENKYIGEYRKEMWLEVTKKD